MDTQQPTRQIPDIKFRVLIIGRANAGKTSILQRVCETTDSPIIYRRGKEVTLDPSIDRGEHRIDDELTFSNHKGYIFHDSCGIESGGVEELWDLKEFIRRKCRGTRLEDRLHAIWYCVPMDNQRPQLDLKFFKGICPDRSVPVIAVFTKYDQFLRNVEIHVEDFGSPNDNVLDVADKQFQEHYLRLLGDDVRFVRLEKMHRQNTRCDTLIETTAAALSNDAVALMLLAVQKDNIKLSVKTALDRILSNTSWDKRSEVIVEECLLHFPYIWYFNSREYEERMKEHELKKRSKQYMEEYLRQQMKEYLNQRLELSERVRSSEYAESESEEYRRLERELSRSVDRNFDSLVKLIVSLPTIQNLTPTSLGGYHLIFAVILILKHATFLELSKMSPESSLAHAEVDYREANINSRIRQYLVTHSQEQSNELFADFIMTTDITCTHILT